MLRIKSDYDLNKLKEKGFVKNGDTFVKYLDITNKDYEFELGIIINPINCEEKNQIVFYANNIDRINYNWDELDTITKENELDVLFDLIQEGAVEKI